MACLNTSGSTKKFVELDEAGLQGAASAPSSSESGALRRQLKLTYVGLALLLLLCLGSIVGVAVLGATVKDQKDKIDRLERNINDLSSSAVYGVNSRSASLRSTDTETEEPEGALLVDNPRETVAGFKMQGHLFAGSGYWSRLKDMIYQRSDHEVRAVGNIVYIMGGMSNTTKSKTILNALTGYDTLSNEMFALKPMPSPRSRFATATINNKIYIMTGYDSPKEETKLQTTMVYDIKTDTWSKGPNTLVPRSDACAVAVRGKIYLAGGWDQDWAMVPFVEVYDPATNKWSKVAQLPTPRGDAKCANLNEQLYVVGGFNDAVNFTGAVEAFDPVTGRWEKKAPLNRARGDLAVVSMKDGRLLALGGERSNGTRNEIATHDVEEYIAQHDTWVPKAALPEARFRFAATAVGEQVYIFGGHPSCNSSNAALPADSCVKNGLKSVYSFVDIEHPDIYLYVKA